MITLGDLKTSIHQRIFAITGTTLPATSAYLNLLPAIIRDGLNELATAGKYIIKSYEITQDGTGTGSVQKYDLSTLTTDFYNFGDNRVYFDDGEEYKATLDYKTEANKVIVLPTATIGTWTVYYNSYPQQITASTPNDTVLDIYPEIEELLILYTCPRVYLDDDAGFCTLWLNMYDNNLLKLKPNSEPPLIVAEHTLESW